jgi:hypothetical protein
VSSWAWLAVVLAGFLAGVAAWPLQDRIRAWLSRRR